MSELDRWLSLACVALWLCYPLAFAFDLMQPTALTVTIPALFCAMHRYFGCESFLPKDPTP